MIRQTGIKIEITPLPYGAYTARPVSKLWCKLFADHMRQYKDLHGKPENELAEVYFQGYWELPETVTRNRQYRYLDSGWDITILVDPWEFGAWLGYDACNVTYKRR